jgi:hypothetical protein
MRLPPNRLMGALAPFLPPNVLVLEGELLFVH